MILKAKERGCAQQLGAYLTRMGENEHVEVHDVRGFVANDVKGAMQEADAIAKGTRCQNHLFSMSLNPPETENVSVEVFEQALSRIEEANGLKGQPRIVVFHEKDGRRHCHAAWSRIDADSMTAIPMSHFKLKLREVSKELYLEHGWRMPRGLMNSAERDPTNFDLTEWQQAKREGRDPRHTKATVQECWAVSDSKASFERALESRGLYLAQGDRRGFVAVTYAGDVVSISRMIGKSAREVRARLGESQELRTVDQTRDHISKVVAPRLKTLMAEADKMKTRSLTPLIQKRLDMKTNHATERTRLDHGIQIRQQQEARIRAQRLRRGVMGIWDRVTGERGRMQRLNDAEALVSLRRDRSQRDEMVSAQLAERRDLQKQIREVRHRHTVIVTGLHRDLSSNEKSKSHDLTGSFNRDRQEDRPRQREVRRGPSFEM